MDITSASVVTWRIVVLAAAGLCAAACGSGPANTPVPQPRSGAPSAAVGAVTTPAAAGVATESPPPGDIPDTTAYIAFRPAAGPYQIKIPEGWARSVSPSAVSFTDNLNTITVTTVRAAAPTVASARAGEVPKIATMAGFKLTDVTATRRPAGSVVLIRYSAYSKPDPVIGKVYTDVVERYEFFRNGTEAIVTLSGPSGADNVDPWRTVTNSFRWLG